MQALRRPIIVTGLMLSAACEPAARPAPESNDVCDSLAVEVALPAALEETSGVAASRSHDGVFWTHNDSGSDPVLFAVDSTGAIRARVRVEAAANRDWEDIASGSCEPRSSDPCLFIGETGDNDGRYPHVAVYRVPEPDPATDTVTAPAEIFRFTYPEGPRDAEGLFVTESGIHVVSKGRSGAIELFRLPHPYPTNATVTVEQIQRLAPPPTSMSAQATAAAADATGRRVVVRTYAGLRFFEFHADTLQPLGRPADGVAPGQMQGEGVDFMDSARLVLTSESQAGRPASLAITTCDPTRPPPDTAGATG